MFELTGQTNPVNKKNSIINQNYPARSVYSQYGQFWLFGKGFLSLLTLHCVVPVPKLTAPHTSLNTGCNKRPEVGFFPTRNFFPCVFVDFAQ